MSVSQLAVAQLAAYNRADLEAFCACYHPDVTVMNADGTVSLQGMAEFRARYGEMFAAHVEVEAEVTERMVLEPHVVERERWSRIVRASGEHKGGWVLVRYTEAEGKIRWVQFLLPG